jgi:hypothetical protein
MPDAPAPTTPEAKILNIADWLSSQVNDYGGGPEEPPQPASEFDYYLAQAASELRSIASLLAAPAEGQQAAPAADASQPESLVPMPEVDGALLHYNPNTGDLIEYVQDYARTYAAACLEAARAPAVRPESDARDAQWWSLVMGAAASIEDASHCLRDEDARRAAIGAAAHYRGAAQKLYATPPQADPPPSAAAPAVQGLSDAEDAEPLTDAEIEMHIGPDEGDREAVTAVVRQVERRFCAKNGIKLAAIDAARALKGGVE